MLSWTGSLKVFLAVEPVDLRKSFEGLYMVVLERMKKDPYSGELYLFTNRNRNRIKLLYWDGTGLWVMTKRLEKGTFFWPKAMVEGEVKLSVAPEALVLLLNGMDLKNSAMRPWFRG